MYWTPPTGRVRKGHGLGFSGFWDTKTRYLVRYKVEININSSPQCIGVRDHFRFPFFFFFFFFFFGGGGTSFDRISYPCPKVEYVLAMHFCHTWGWGVFGGGEDYSFDVIGYWKPRRGKGYPPPTVRWRTFLDSGVNKTRFWCVI